MQESKRAGPTKDNYIPEILDVKLRDLLVLFVNLHRAKANPELGYQDADNQFGFTLRILSDEQIRLPRAQLEGLLWACVHLDERGEFYHPDNVKLDTFIARLMHHKKFKFYFDKIYSFFRETRPRTGVPPEAVISSEQGEE